MSFTDGVSEIADIKAHEDANGRIRQDGQLFVFQTGAEVGVVITSLHPGAGPLQFFGPVSFQTMVRTAENKTRPRQWTHRLAAVLVAVAVAVSSGCAAPDLKALPLDADGNPDPVHVVGQDVWVTRCTTCHGATGNGGAGPKLGDGRVGEKYPEIGVQVSIIANGVGGRMPAWKDRLTREEIEAVTRYTREVL